MNDNNTVVATQGEPPMLNNAIFISEAARILALCPETVRTLEKTGRLRAMKIGKGVRLFDRAEVEKLARARETAAE